MPKKIAVIGGGFSGTMVIRQLIDQGFQGSIDRFCTANSQTLGPAYNPQSAHHLLNVRSQNMSAFPDKPNHFIEFLQDRHPEISHANEFVPRAIYGKYLQSLWEETQILAAQSNILLKLIIDETPDFTVYDTLVLATGNELPRFPKQLPLQLKNSPFYHGNPWRLNLELIPNEKPIFILGNGLTMADTVLSLREWGFQQKIVALSTHGFQMLPHPEKTLEKSDEKSPNETDLLSLLHFFNVRRKELSLAQFLHCVDSFRSLFSTWWMGFTLHEKKVFLSRLRHIWGTVRHRIPLEISQIIQNERETGRLVVCAGKLENVVENERNLILTYRTGQYEILESVACIINCTGPETAITRMSNRVIQQLLDRKWITPDEIDQGIKIDTNQHHALGEAPMNIYAIGNLCKGTFWESTAIGELRSQAQLIAKGILDSN